MDQLKPPKHFPSPSIIYSLRELTIVWHLYGGRDFSGHPLQSSHSSSSVHKKHKMAATASEEQVSFHKRGGVQNGWRRKGGSGRDFDVLMEIELSRVGLVDMLVCKHLLFTCAFFVVVFFSF